MTSRRHTVNLCINVFTGVPTETRELATEVFGFSYAPHSRRSHWEFSHLFLFPTFFSLCPLLIYLHCLFFVDPIHARITLFIPVNLTPDSFACNHNTKHLFSGISFWGSFTEAQPPSTRELSWPPTDFQKIYKRSVPTPREKKVVRSTCRETRKRFDLSDLVNEVTYFCRWLTEYSCDP